MMFSTAPTASQGLQVKFWGVRGSVSASGPDYREFGGHTPCVEIRMGERLFIVDAGTGISALGAALGDAAPKEIDLLLSHLHLDHIVGLPFFKPALMKDRTLTIHCGNLGGDTAEEALDRVFSPPVFPLRICQFPGRVRHVGFRAGETLSFADGVAVQTCPLQHPSGATGYRFAHSGRVVVYVSDIEHGQSWPPDQLAAFVADADLLIFDAMFSETEYTACRGWGHSTWQAGVELCRAANVKALAIFHLHPQHGDAHLRAVEREVQAVMPSAFVAREGMVLNFAPLAVAAGQDAAAC